MKDTITNWLLIGVAVLAIGTFVFGTMYSTISSKTTEMNTSVTSTSLP